MKVKIRTKIISGFLVIVFFMLGLGIYSLFGQQQITRMNNEIIDRQIPSIIAAKNVEISTMDKVAALRGYLITSNESEADRFTYHISQTQKYAEESLNLSLTEEGKLQSQQLNQLIEEYDNIGQRIIGLHRSGDNVIAIEEMNTLAFPKVQEIKQLAENIIARREQRVDATAIEMKEINDSVGFITMLTLGVSLVISIAVGTILTRNITKPINQLVEISKSVAEGDLTHEINIKTRDEISLLGESFNKMTLSLRQLIMQTAQVSEQVAATSQQLAASSEEASATSEEVSVTINEVASAASEQASTIEQSNTLITKISHNMQQVSFNVENINISTNGTLNFAKKGINASQEVVEKMNNIRNSTEETSKVVMLLSENSNEIEKIVDTIGAIANQTNLLALNAAIEAARAGEAGRGFAVVAEEIRKLAEQSSQSSSQISQLILDIQTQIGNVVNSMRASNSEVETGAEIVNNSNIAFNEIYNSISQVANQVNEVSNLAKEVTRNTIEITSNFESMSAISQQTAASAQEVAAGSEEQTAAMEEIASSATNLSSMADELSHSISIFKY